MAETIACLQPSKPETSPYEHQAQCTADAVTHEVERAGELAEARLAWRQTAVQFHAEQAVLGLADNAMRVEEVVSERVE